MLRTKEVMKFQKKILSWYKSNKRDLPWRRTRSLPAGRRAYHILVSEVMLQQTQVARVIPKYEAWFEKFPTLASLANASPRDVLTVWSGLGYNRRGLYLKQIAQIVVRDCKGKFPQDEKSLKQLPGIGEYTARAILCFAFDQQVAVVDTNVRKVIIHTFGPGSKNIQEIADTLLPKGKAYDWNHALMDYSSSVLKKEKIPMKKQSKFTGSDRYFRGRIIKLLTQKGRISIEHLGLEIENERLHTILDGLVRDGLVKKNGNTIVL